MERVSREEVIHSWLQRDLEEHSDKDVSIEELNESEKAAQLLELNSNAASPFLKHSFDWYETTLSKKEFQQLYTVWENFGVPDDTITKLGKGLNNGDPEVTEPIENSDIDEKEIQSIAEGYPQNTPDGSLIITTVERGTPRIADGNHRATGLALHMAQGGDYQPQKAYLGFTTPPKIQNLSKRLRTKALKIGRIL